VAKQTFKITNWKAYNKALINRGSLTFWLDESAIQAWYDQPKTPSRGRPQRYSEAFPGLIRQTHRKIKAACADGAYDTKRCHDELRRKKIKALIPAANTRRLLAGRVCRQKSGSGEATAYWEQCLLEMAHGLRPAFGG
jgi:hypothetical protein